MTDQFSDSYDVIVVGGGNAALSAAIAAREAVDDVLVLEKAPAEQRGGNSYFTGGRMRIPHGDLEDLASLLALDIADLDGIHVDEYSEMDFIADVQKQSRYKSDDVLLRYVATGARPALEWLKTHGARFELALGYDEVKVDGKIIFHGGDDVLHAEGGPGLIANLYAEAERMGIDIRYEAAVERLLRGPRGVEGVVVRQGWDERPIRSKSVILACGGFESSAEMRAEYLGPGWDLAKVRGTKYNTGDGHKMALDIGASAAGHWSGCHSTACDAMSPDYGKIPLGHTTTRTLFRAGITVDRHGRRFFDEGEDLRAFSYAVSGRKVIELADGYAVQVFDSKAVALLERKYLNPEATRYVGEDLASLAEELEVDPDGLVATVKQFNDAAPGVEADFSQLDGVSTIGLDPPKSNWAVPIDTPPYYGFPVTAGITFTFGGLAVNTRAEVLDHKQTAIPGLYAAGEIVGGIFYYNYPGGTGLVTGMVMGKTAGETAAAFALRES